MIGVAVLMVERQARMRMEIAILVFFKTPILSHQVSQHPTNRSDWAQPPRRDVGRELSSEPAFGAGSPVRFVVRGKFGPGGVTMAAKAPAAGCWSPPGENLCSQVFRPLRENAPAGASQQKPPCTKLLLHCLVNSFLKTRARCPLWRKSGLTQGGGRE